MEANQPSHPPAVQAWLNSLSKAESRVARLFLEGLAPKEIGARLFIAPRTVFVHLHHIRKKMKPHRLRFVLRLEEVPA